MAEQQPPPPPDAAIRYSGRVPGRDFLAALVTADSWFGRRTVDNDPPWLRYFDGAELAAEFAHSYRDLGMAAKAVEYGRIAVEDADPLYARSIAFCQLVLAAGQVGQGEIEQGIDTAAVAVGAVGDLKSVRSREYVHDFVRQLEPLRQYAPVAGFIRNTQAAVA